jgi:hypothetical protein
VVSQMSSKPVHGLFTYCGLCCFARSIHFLAENNMVAAVFGEPRGGGTVYDHANCFKEGAYFQRTASSPVSCP